MKRKSTNRERAELLVAAAGMKLSSRGGKRWALKIKTLLDKFRCRGSQVPDYRPQGASPTPMMLDALHVIPIIAIFVAGGFLVAKAMDLADDWLAVPAAVSAMGLTAFLFIEYVVRIWPGK
jgi:hypothetical protein